MNRRNLPFNALRAFEAAARHASVSAAASELSVTHSAVSHQLKQLEAELGLKLFRRTNRGLQITAEGETLLPVLIDSFDRISAALENVMKTNENNIIHVTTTPSFASKWLVPRLSRWYSNPGAARIHLQPTLDFLDLESNRIDLAIRCGVPPWPALDHKLLLPIHLTPVCNSVYANSISKLTQATDLLKHNLIHADVGDHGLGEEWSDWFIGCGLKHPGKLEGLSFHDPALAMQAAADGLGIAIGYRELIEEDLLSSNLIMPLPQLVKHRYSYYLVNNSNHHRQLERFCDWLTSEVKAF